MCSSCRQGWGGVGGWVFLFSVFGGFFTICGTFSLGTMGFERTSMLTWLFQCDFQDEAGSRLTKPQSSPRSWCLSTSGTFKKEYPEPFTNSEETYTVTMTPHYIWGMKLPMCSTHHWGIYCVPIFVPLNAIGPCC